MMEEKSLKAQEIMKKQELSMMADIEDLEAETSKNKSQLTKQFDLLRRSIDTKEKELHAYLDDLFQRN
jgi:spore coat protein CotH